MKIGFIQSFPKFGEKERNVRGAVERMSEVEADLVVLPELFNSGYLFRSVQELEELSEEIPEGFTTQTLMEIARKRSTYVVGGLPERAGKIFYNSAVLVGPEGFIDLYRKAHLFADEPKWFEKGDTPFRVHDIGLARVGVLICFDWIFPEAARTLALRGADIICHPSNLVLPYCQKAMVTRSLENGLFSITCNRIG
ncbi:MAG: nitrilase-related carbon-nitrogen hydrolase, partial [bacterium]